MDHVRRRALARHMRRMSGSAGRFTRCWLLVSKIFSFCLHVLGVNLRLESHALLLNTGIMDVSHITANTEISVGLTGHLFPRKQLFSSVAGNTLDV